MGAFIIDADSRMVVGWQASRSLRSDLAVDALEMAVHNRRREGADLSQLTHHSDRGVQYLSVRYSQRLDDNGDRWLTVGAPGQEGVELLLEPAGHPAVGPYRDSITGDGIPLASFAVDLVEAEHARLTAAGVTFTQPPTVMGPVTTAVLDDTCGNLIQLVSM